MATRVSPIIEKAPYVAAGGTGIAALTLNDWYMIVGIATSILGFIACFLLNWYYKRKDDKRKQVEHELAVSGALERRK
jgi:membrane associated rhomboid family serine protease